MYSAIKISTPSYREDREVWNAVVRNEVREMKKQRKRGVGIIHLNDRETILVYEGSNGNDYDTVHSRKPILSKGNDNIIDTLRDAKTGYYIAVLERT